METGILVHLVLSIENGTRMTRVVQMEADFLEKFCHGFFWLRPKKHLPKPVSDVKIIAIG